MLYTQGCVWRCRYCHNSHLWPFHSHPATSFQEALDFLEKRLGLLEGVVFSGGEPTAHEVLPSAMNIIKKMGFEIGLHTTGMYPEVLRASLLECDWVGMDIKAPFRAYERITQAHGSGANPSESVDIILRSDVEHEFRTTIHPDLLSEDEILEIARELRDRGAQRFVLQAFQPTNCQDGALKDMPRSTEIVSRGVERELVSMFRSFQIRK